MKFKCGLSVLLAVVFASMSMLTAFAGSTESDFGDVISVTFEDGVLTVEADGDFGSTDWIGVYKEGETTDPNSGGVASIFWWYIGVDGGEVSYPDDAGGSTVLYNRYEELDGESANSPLKPGNYQVIVMVNDGYQILEGTEPVNFTVPEPVQPTEVPGTAVPTDIPASDVPATEDPATDVPAEPTDVPTEEPTEVITEVPTEVPAETATDIPADEPTEAAATDKPADATAVPAEGTAEPKDAQTKKANTGLIIGICAAAAVVIAAAAGILIARSKKK